MAEQLNQQFNRRWLPTPPIATDWERGTSRPRVTAYAGSDSTRPPAPTAIASAASRVTCTAALRSGRLLASSRYTLWQVLALLAFSTQVFAHRLDEYLQATLVVVEPERVRLQINLTPGIAVAEQVLAQIDRDHDGLVSTNEAAAYFELLKRDLRLRLDQRMLELMPTASCFPALDELRSGLGIIQVEFASKSHKLAAGAHDLTLENRHLPGLSVYLVNAAQPAANSIQITKQIRNENQSVSQIQFFCHPPPGDFKVIGLVALLLILFASVSLGLHQTRKPY